MTPSEVAVWLSAFGATFAIHPHDPYRARMIADQAVQAFRMTGGLPL